MFQTAYNATDAPIVVSAEGHNIGAHEFGAADVEFSADQVEAGLLHLFPGGIKEGAGQNPQALDAQRQVAELNGKTAPKAAAAEKGND